MRIVLTGATGLIGKKLCHQLFVQGHDLIVLTRNTQTADARVGLPVQAFGWDAGESAAPLDALRGADALIHLAGEPIAEGRWSRSKMEKIRSSRVHGTRRIVEAMRALGEHAPKTLISSSAIGIYGNRGEEALTEESAPGAGFLADVCQAWENEAAALASTPASGRVVFLRTGVILSPDGGMLRKVAPIFRSGIGGELGNGKQWLSWIHIDDMVAAILHALRTPSLRGPVNCTAPQPATNSDFSRALSRALGKPALIRTPAAAIKASLGKMSEAVLSSQRVLPNRLEGSGFEFRHPELKGALDSFRDRLLEDSFSAVQWVPKPVDEVSQFFSDEKNLEAITPDGPGFRLLRKLRGPFSKWEQTHTLSPARGGTLIEDRVLFRIPGGALGSGLLGSWIRKDVQKALEYRSRKVKERFA